MPSRPKHREAIVQAAVTLFRRRGYSATGINDIVAMSGAPKGSLYHYFPGGKASIAEAAVRAAGRNVTGTLNRLQEDHRTAGKLVRAYGGLLAEWMAQSGFSAGCPIATTLLETAPDDEAVTEAGREAFAGWRGIIASRLTDSGVPRKRSNRLAALVIAALEGALIQARVERSTDVIEDCARELEALLNAAASRYAQRKRKT